jgi:ketosteroid isomerase-like protein
LPVISNDDRSGKIRDGERDYKPVDDSRTGDSSAPEGKKFRVAYQRVLRVRDGRFVVTEGKPPRTARRVRPGA